MIYIKNNIICAALFLICCGPPPNKNFIHLNIVDTNDFVINSAIELMNDVNVATKCEIFGDNKTGVRRQISLKEATPDKLPDDAIGLFDPNTNTITLSDTLSKYYNRRFKPILLHEVGHSLGLDHVEGTFMSKQYNDGISYANALKQFTTMLNENGLNPCDLPKTILPPNE
jgi:hypothetical protein